MKLHTSRFGEIDIDEERTINFPQGLLGFSDIKRYIILDHPNKPDMPLKWLQSADNPDLAFVITDPLMFCPDYSPEIEEKNLKELNIFDSSERVIIVIVTIPHGEPEKMTANLQGPILVNLKTREAKQVVLTGEEYPLRHPLLKDTPILKS